MLQLAWFFRQTPEVHTQETNITMYVVAAIFFAAGVLWYVRYAPKWRLRWEGRLMRPLYVLTFLSFIGITAWRAYHMGVFQALPLTWIGLAQLVMLATMVYPSQLLQKNAAIIGFSAAVLMFVTPAPSEFVWPHVSLALYFIAAFSAGWLATILALSVEDTWRGPSVIKSAFLMTIYEALRMIVNHLTPVDVQLLHQLPFGLDADILASRGFFVAFHLIYALIVVTAIGFFLIYIRRVTDAVPAAELEEWQTTTLHKS